MLFTLIAKGTDALFGLEDWPVGFMLGIRNILLLMQLLKYHLHLFADQLSLNIN